MSAPACRRLAFGVWRAREWANGRVGEWARRPWPVGTNERSLAIHCQGRGENGIRPGGTV
jgi:hypothetical protein